MPEESKTTKSFWRRLADRIERDRLRGISDKLFSVSCWAANCNYDDVVKSIGETRNLIRQKIEAI